MNYFLLHCPYITNQIIRGKPKINFIKCFHDFLSLNGVQEESVAQIWMYNEDFLSHQHVWATKLKYVDIIKAQVSYVKRHYGSNCVVVFAGYTNSDLSMKSSERRLRLNINNKMDI